LQRGPGNDFDGLYALIECTTSAVGLPAEVGEELWLDTFFDVRIDDLTNPYNVETAGQWRESTERVECMRRIADSGNYDLDGRITFTVYGDEFIID
jgi:chitosanase